MIARLRRLLPPGQVLRFAVVGLAATAAHFCVLSAGVEIAGIPPAPANGLAFAAAVGVTYAGQSLWVFRAPARSPRQMQKFLLSAGGGFIANIALMAGIVRGLALDYRVGFVAVTITVPLGTFLVNKFWVFAHGPNEQRDF